MKIKKQCPECQSESFRFGYTKQGVQRWKCKQCSRIFVDNTIDIKSCPVCDDTRGWCVNKQNGRCTALTEVYEKDRACPFYKKLLQN